MALWHWLAGGAAAYMLLNKKAAAKKTTITPDQAAAVEMAYAQAGYTGAKTFDLDGNMMTIATADGKKLASLDLTDKTLFGTNSVTGIYEYRGSLSPLMGY